MGRARRAAGRRRDPGPGVADPGGQIWDFAATALIVEEAGGCYGGADGIRGPRPGVSLFAADRALWGAAHAALWPA
nr:hypothetical protein GCM10020092_044550 [Actinoplanes digitatis]